jgi:hypothetical protein
MSTVSLPANRVRTTRPGSRNDNFFFSTMALLILATVFVGFARTYFLAGVFRAPLPNILIHIHGVVFSAWIVLLIAQISLVSAGRVDIHRKLGLWGFGLACLMVVMGVLAASDSLLRGFSPPGSGLDPKTFYAIPILGILVFAVLVFFAYRARFNPAAHKRLIMLATISLLLAPTGRPPFTAITSARPYLAGFFVWLFVLLLIGYDLWSTRKVQRATIWGGLFVVVAIQLLIPIGMTNAFHGFATFMLSLKI